MNERETVAEMMPENKKENSSSIKWKADPSQSSAADRVMFLQRTLGNQAVENLIRSGTLQARLRIGPPGDKYEQEADRVAEAVVRMPEHKAVSSGAPYIQKACPTCEGQELKRQPIKEEEEEKLQRKPKEEEEEKLQRKPKEEEEEKLQKKPNEEKEELQTKSNSGRSFEISHNIESQIQSLKGGGQPLSENSRAFYEPRLGHDFSHVRVHTDTQAAKLAESVNAQAFTVGKDVVFSAGHYAPEKTEGKKLLAHELTHVVQQG
ncbi:MAG: DUF4157 domain-containing protein [Desulfobacterales bacterium]|nr:DUF4157 domain-containing protein [Desulfobacterales bacterium]